jgi:glutathione S-transferase
MMDLKLYDMDRSGNCYKVRLLLAMLGLNYEREPIDSTEGETQTVVFKHLNPRGQIPVLVDGETVIWDSMAILVYLARRYGDERWLPSDALGEARVMQWLAVSENELLYGLARARVTVRFSKPFDLEQCHRDAKPGLEAMEQRLVQYTWLATEYPSIADLACYPYVSLANEGRFSLEPYPAVRAWLKRIEGLPGWIPMIERAGYTASGTIEK